jgi:hypothetical protein
MKWYFLNICFLLYSIGFGQNETQVHRKGFAFGLATGVARTHLKFPAKQQNSTNLAINWKLGYGVHPKLVLLLNGAVSLYHYDLYDRPRLRDFGGIFPAAQYFISPRLWLLTGIGISTEAPVFFDINLEHHNETKYYSGIGLLSAIGYEFYQHKHFTLDLQTRFNYGVVYLPTGKMRGLSTSVSLGINFY